MTAAHVNLYWPQDPLLEAQMRDIHAGLKDALIAAERAHDRIEAKNGYPVMSSERAGTPTHGRLDREKARQTLEALVSLGHNTMDSDIEGALDALEACVLPDPRTTCASRWVVTEDESDEYHGDWRCALPIGHGGPHVEARYGYRWNDDHATNG